MFLQNQGKPDADAVGAEGESELDGCQREYPDILEGCQEVMLNMCAALGVQRILQRGAFFGGEPLCVPRMVGQYQKRDDAERDGGDAFRYEYPLPAVQVKITIHPEQEGGGRSADQR